MVVDPKDSNIVWVGSGENGSQRSAHFGDGVYKSTDAGKTFKNMGLKTSEHIGKIIVDPRNSNTVWVASQGPLFSEGGERSLYKTTDGGNTWTAALTITKDTGVNDIVLDPANPDIIYASSYQRRRHVGQMIGGGSEGGIWKSMDGGKKFTKLTNGLEGVRRPHRARNRSAWSDHGGCAGERRDQGDAGRGRQAGRSREAGHEGRGRETWRGGLRASACHGHRAHVQER